MGGGRKPGRGEQRRDCTGPASRPSKTNWDFPVTLTLTWLLEAALTGVLTERVNKNDIRIASYTKTWCRSLLREASISVSIERRAWMRRKQARQLIEVYHHRVLLQQSPTSSRGSVLGNECSNHSTTQYASEKLNRVKQAAILTGIGNRKRTRGKIQAWKMPLSCDHLSYGKFPSHPTYGSCSRS